MCVGKNKKTINNLSVENSKMANTCVHPAGHFCAAARWVFLLFTCVRDGFGQEFCELS